MIESTNTSKMTYIECSICYDELTLNVNVCTTTCGHKFCMGCFIKCTQQNNKCPLCRVELYEEEEDMESEDMEEDEDYDSELEYNGTDNADGRVTIEQLEERLIREGITMKHILRLLMYSMPSESVDLSGNHNRLRLEEKISDIVDEMVEERIDEDTEREAMNGEDVNVLAEYSKMGTLDNPHILVPSKIVRTELKEVARDLTDDFNNC